MGDKLKIGIVGRGLDASNWRAWLAQGGLDPAVAETLGAHTTEGVDLLLVFAQSADLAMAAEACAAPGRPPSALLRLEPGRVHPLTLLVQALAAGPRREWTATAARAGLTLEEVERQYIRTVLDVNHGHRGKTARALGLDPKTLYNKLGAARPRKGRRALQGGEAGR